MKKKHINEGIPVYTDVNSENRFKETTKELRELRDLRSKYHLFLGDFFHHKSAEDLARDYLNPVYRDFVEDYISIIYLPEFREKYEKAKQSPLESKVQTSPKFTPDKETQKAAKKFVEGIEKGVITKRPLPNMKTTKEFDVNEASERFDKLISSEHFEEMMKGAYKY